MAARCCRGHALRLACAARRSSPPSEAPPLSISHERPAGPPSPLQPTGVTDPVGSPTTGIGFALGAMLMWGLLPAYWKALHHVDATEILAHRMVWSLLFVVALLARERRWSWLRPALSSPRVPLTYLAAGLLLTVNWGTYIWAVNANFIVEASLGYFLNPLVNVLFGALLLGERPRRGQWMAIAVAASGVAFLTLRLGRLPWVTLVLAVTFSIYSVVKKRAPLGALEGLGMETSLLFVPAAGYLTWVELTRGGALGHSDPATTALLVLTGAATALPLLFYAAALRRMSLTTLGIIQYLAPSIQFLLGVLVYREPFDLPRLFGFGLIWAGLALFTWEGLLVRRQRLRGALSA